MAFLSGLGECSCAFLGTCVSATMVVATKQNTMAQKPGTVPGCNVMILGLQARYGLYSAAHSAGPEEALILVAALKGTYERF